MPNLWSTTTQKIYEAFYGVRTRDTEYEAKVEEIKACERHLQGVKTIFFNFQKNTQGIKILCKEVYTHLAMAYGENSPYWSTIVEITQIYQEIEKMYDTIAEKINMLATQTQEWDRNFDDVKKNLAIREEYRRTYDHYDEKLEKLVKVRSEKSIKGVDETQKEAQTFERNDLKYKKATDEFLKQSVLCYTLMCDLLEFRYKLINPAVATFISEERKFHIQCSNLLNKFDNLQSKFQNLDRQFKKEGQNYDPRRYVRGHKLLLGVNTNELPSLKSNEAAKQKYSYNDYLQNKNLSSSSGSNFNNIPNTYSNPSPNNLPNQIPTNKNLQSDPNKYSYEQYMMMRGGSSMPSMSSMTSQKNEVSSNYNIGSSNIQSFGNYQSPEFGNIKRDSFNLDKGMSQMNLNKPEELRKTTIIPQSDFSTEQQVDNPYSLLNFKDFKPQSYQPQSMSTSTINRPQTGMGNMGIPNYSQLPNQNYNFQNMSVGPNTNLNTNLTPNPYMNFPGGNNNGNRSQTFNMNGSIPNQNLNFPSNNSNIQFPR